MKPKYCCMSDEQPKHKSPLPSINELVSGLGAKPRLRGLGDAVARVTDALHIPKCGSCATRQKLLNKILPFGKQSH